MRATTPEQDDPNPFGIFTDPNPIRLRLDASGHWTTEPERQNDKGEQGEALETIENEDDTAVEFTEEPVIDKYVALQIAIEKEARDKARAAVESAHETPAGDEQHGKDHRNDRGAVGTADTTSDSEAS